MLPKINMKKIITKIKIKKYMAIVMVALLIFLQAYPVSAYEVPTPPQAPLAPSAPSTPLAPEVPTQPSSPIPEAPKAADVPTTKDETTISIDVPKDQTKNTDQTQATAENSPVQTDNSVIQTQSPNSQNISSDGNSGDTKVQTGDATNSVVGQITANQNIAVDSNNQSQKINAENSNNGNNSSNQTDATIINNNTNIQTNNANVSNILEQITTTGSNSASKNMGDSFISTGDANTSGTLLTGLNTNLNGVEVSEFNVADDHTGDIVLNFGGSNCISGCTGSPISTANNGNGSNSNNTVQTSEDINNQSFQNNNANVSNSLALSSDSGNNASSQNTNGDSVINTGDANVVADVLTFVNNNILGNVIVGVVNIFGNLIGDIILPENAVGTGDLSTATNNDNGSSSNNNIAVSKDVNDSSIQTNIADIENNLNLTATTGGNETNKNTGGDSVVKTGNSDVNAQTVNIVNSNTDGGNLWLVFINKAGTWVGKILGQPQGTDFAGSQGTEFTVDANGNINVTNSGNGSNSQNQVNLNNSQNNNTVQTNNAKVTNDINLSSNTGANQTNKNTGGTSFINTGDAKVIANLINFVNNNIKSDKKLVIAFINVFGEWLGDFIPPGITKPEEKIITQNNNSLDPKNEQSLADNNVILNPINSEQSATEGNTTIVNNQSSLISSDVMRDTRTPSGNWSTPGALVAGISTNINNPFNFPSRLTMQKAKNLNKKMNINLAWLIVIIPLTVSMIALGKKFKIIDWITK
ncbi:hypothetical protein C4559_04315 [Candidatus Microgenomates bacterium]|nr:MAG: hypothetical protein C4559_04315 [Candidatus Microgenomates bacterium]